MSCTFNVKNETLFLIPSSIRMFLLPGFLPSPFAVLNEIFGSSDFYNIVLCSFSVKNCDNFI